MRHSIQRALIRFVSDASCKQQTLCIKRCMSSGSQLRFDGKTAIITGAGRGLGREYALLLASRGANVVVNDYGGDRLGHEVADEKQVPANQVIQEINRRFPNSKTLVDTNSISSESGASALVDATLNTFGRVDILVNNAGILRDKSFAKMSIDDWDQVHGVHLRGSFLMSKACWPHMRKQKYGKIMMTSSTSGLYGNFGQANYSAAKLGLVGLCNTLAIEGAKDNIFCNTIVPMAASRMTHDILPEELISKLSPAYVAPIVAWLCHEDCQETAAVVEAAGQWYGRYKLHRTKGKFLPGISDDDHKSSIETIASNWTEISSFQEGASHVDSFQEHLGKLLEEFEKNKA